LPEKYLRIALRLVGDADLSVPSETLGGQKKERDAKESVPYKPHGNKKQASRNFLPDACFLTQNGILLILGVSFVGETIAAVDRALALGLKGHFRLLAAFGAGGCKVLTGTTGRRFAAVPAGLAALRLILETTFRIKLLLTGRK